MVKTAVFVSGSGTNLQALIAGVQDGSIKNCDLALVVSSKADAYALTRAQVAGIDAVVCEKKGVPREEYDQKILKLLQDNDIEFIVLAGFLHIFGADFFKSFHGRIINVHPSLIPSFCGKGFYGLKVHEAALAYGVKLSGATVHFVNEVTDGGEIILQKAVRILPGDTPEKLQKRIMKQAEQKILPQAVSLICENKI